MNQPTEAQIEWAVGIQRAAASGTMVYKGRRVTQADTRKALRIMAAAR